VLVGGATAEATKNPRVRGGKGGGGEGLAGGVPLSAAPEE